MANSLCPEILEQIFGFLPAKDLSSVAKVCPVWNEIAKHSLRRRMQFHVDVADRFRLELREFESHDHMELFVMKPSVRRWLQDIRQIQVPPPEMTGFLKVQVKDFKLSLLAVMAMKPEWCMNISKLEFESIVDVEEWNVLGTSVLSFFPNLMKIDLNVQYRLLRCFLRLKRLLLHGSDTGSKTGLNAVQWEGFLRFEYNEKSQFDHPIFTALNDEWRSTVRKIESFGVMTVQNWNVVWCFVKSRFTNLQKVQVILEWSPPTTSGNFEGDEMLSKTLSTEPEEPTEKVEKAGDQQFERTQSFMALISLNTDSCTKITELKFKNELAVQDWNVAGIHVLSKFPNLKKLHLNLVFVPDYESTNETDNFPTDAVFHNLEYMEIKLKDVFNQEPLAVREAMKGDFVTHCPNLKMLISYEARAECACQIELSVDYKGFKTKDLDVYLNINQFRNKAHDGRCGVIINGKNSIFTALAPLINSLPFKSLRLDHDEHVSGNLQFLQLMNKENFRELDSLRLRLSYEPEQSKRQTQWLLTLLNRQGCTMLENLEVIGSSAMFDRDFFDHVDETGPFDLALPNVKKLRIGLCDIFDVDLLFLDYLVEALPNVQELFTSTQHNSDPANSENFFKYSARFKNLTILDFKWNSPRNPEPGWLEGIKEILAKHEALETLLLRVTFLGGRDDYEVVIEDEAWKAIVCGCAAAPRMRLLKLVYSSCFGPTTEQLERLFNQLKTPVLELSPGFRLEIVDCDY